MTLDELDRLAAEKVMGWKPRGMWYAKPPMFDGGDTAISSWQPTRNISQAWECLEKLLGEYKCIAQFGLGRWWLSLKDVTFHDSTPSGIFTEKADSAPEAIVRACLKAKGVEV